MLIALVLFALLTNTVVSQWLCYGIEKHYPPAGDEQLAQLDGLDHIAQQVERDARLDAGENDSYNFV